MLFFGNCHSKDTCARLLKKIIAELPLKGIRFAHAIYRPPCPRLTNLKTCVCALINFAYESVKYLYFLSSGAVMIFNYFMHDYLFNQRVKHLCSKFRGFGVLLD